MKKPIHFFLLAAGALFICASLVDGRFTLFKNQCDLRSDLPKTFADIKAFLARPEPSKAEAERLEQKLADLRGCIDKSINATEFTYALTEQLKPVKAARCKVIDDIASLIQPYNAWLLELTFGVKTKTSADVINKVTILLHFTKPDEFMVQTLRKQAEKKSDGFWSAIRLLYEHDLMDQSMRDVLREFVLSQTTPEAKRLAALGAVSFGIGGEAIPYCEELLQQPFKPDGLINEKGYPQGNQLTMDYLKACDTLECIGTNADSLLPLLKKRQEEVVNAKGIEAMKPFILGNFYAAIKCLEGTRPVQVGWKSPHCTWCK
jgi:hypothetical protein